MVTKSPCEEIRDSPEMNMTPMIDIVFQLIIFFMIAIDLSQKDLEDLVLPSSTMAIEDEPEEGRLCVNIDRKGEYSMSRNALSLSDLDQELRARVDLPQSGNRPVRGPDGWSPRPILIRADRASEFTHVQRVLYLCGQAGLKIWKVELAGGQAKAGEVQR